jgi:Protein of unknown function (DUF2721)
MFKRMTLAPISAIAVMVAPVVLLSASATLLTAVLSSYSIVTTRVLRISKERVGILSGPAADRERLTEIDDEMPMMLRRVGRLKVAAAVLYSAIAFLVLGVIAIGVADASGSLVFAYLALSLVLAGTVALFSAVVVAVGLVFRSDDASSYQAKRSRKLGHLAAPEPPGTRKATSRPLRGPVPKGDRRCIGAGSSTNHGNTKLAQPSRGPWAACR